MSTPVIAVFNNKGGVGKTSMVYHLSWMLADRGIRAVAADLDPQSNLTACFLDEDRLEQLFGEDDHSLTVFGCLQPIKKGIGDIASPHLETISDELGLVPGDMALSTFEDQLSEVWPKCMDKDERAFRVTSALWRVLQRAAGAHNADLILVDLGPNLGAINRAALIASDHVLIPLGPDLFSLQGLRNLGPAIRDWREAWRERVARNPNPNLELPPGRIHPIGYIVLRHSIRLDRPVKAFERWMARIPNTYRESVLQQDPDPSVTVDTDPHCVGKLKDYRSLMPMAQEAHKPMFHLQPADGALGSHMAAVTGVYKDFLDVARNVGQRIEIDVR